MKRPQPRLRIDAQTSRVGLTAHSGRTARDEPLGARKNQSTMPSSKTPRKSAARSGPGDDAPIAVRRRLAPEDRERQIVEQAISFFAREGFGASTRDLARELGITQPLLYRYFPDKDSLVERVYDEVFSSRWNPEWEVWLADRSVSIEDRLKRYLRDYAQFVLRSEWIRIFIFAGLAREGINRRYLERLRERHFRLIARELRHSFQLTDAATPADEEEEIELIWAMHSSVFYIGVRKWIYGLPVPADVDRTIDQRVDSFILGFPAVMRAARPIEAAQAGKPKKPRRG